MKHVSRNRAFLAAVALLGVGFAANAGAGDLYVSTNGSGGAGTNWSTAYVDISDALSAASDNDTIHVAGQVFALTRQIDWTNSTGLTIRGGYEAVAGAVPGGNDPALWPTVITRDTNHLIRIMAVSNVTDGTLSQVTLTGGYIKGANENGGGIRINASSLSITSCIVSNNLNEKSGQNTRDKNRGGGLYLWSSRLVISDSIIRNNRADGGRASQTLGRGDGGGLWVGGESDLRMTDSIVRDNIARVAGYEDGRGGGLFVDDSANTVVVSNSVFMANLATGNPSGRHGFGGGIYLGNGTHTFRNCLIATNDCDSKNVGNERQGHGVYLVNGTVTFDLCTVVDNQDEGYATDGEGIRVESGSVTVTNSILWGNGDDVVGVIELHYSSVEDGDNAGADGCVSANPIFVDREYYHLASEHGVYVDGYFSAGTWSVSGASSPLIDACDPGVVPTLEPDPNGAIANMGVYGNTVVASKSHPLAVTNLPASAVTPTTATLNGRLSHMGSADVHVWFYWGQTDEGDVAANWATNRYVGVLTCAQDFSIDADGLQADATYYYACFASNAAAATEWATPTASFLASVSEPEIANTGVDNDGTALTTLKGEVTSTGGNEPQVTIYWGHTDGGTSTGAWDYAADAGAQSGAFAVEIATAPASNYWYSCYATNSAGTAWGSPSLPFGHDRIRYVSADATGAGNGYNWENAYPDIQTALNDCSDQTTNIVYIKQGVFTLTGQLEITNDHVRLTGGYAGAGAPGLSDPEQWPTVISNTASFIRLINVDTAANVAIAAITLTGGNMDGPGGGILVNNASNVTLNTCRIVANNSSGVNNFDGGGGICGLNSWGLITNCYIAANTVSADWNAYGGGVRLSGGGWTVQDSVLHDNRAQANHGHGAGLFVQNSGSHTVKNCLIVQNLGAGNSTGDGIYQTDAATLNIGNCTVAGNRNEGVRGANGACSISNTILWDNGDDLAGALGSVSFSIVEDGDGGAQCSDADPLFEYGVYVGSDSPAIDAGSVTAETLGLDGYTVLADGATDSGPVDLGYHQSAGKDPAFADLYVAPHGNDSNAGTNPAAPLRSISAALTAAGMGTHVHLESGRYTAAAGETFPLTLQTGVRLLGAGRESTFVDAGGSARVFAITEVSLARLDGLTAMGGYLDGEHGAGVYIDTASLGIGGCAIASNSIWHAQNSNVRGAGIYSIDSRVRMTNCSVHGNYTDSGSGAQSSNAGAKGGGIYIETGAWRMLDTVISNNIASSLGNNGTAGGGLYIASGDHLLQRIIVSRNSSEGRDGKPTLGGGIFMSGGRVRNALIVTNSAGQKGGGVYMDSASAVLENATVANNRTGTDSAGLYMTDGAVSNSIVFFNYRITDGVVTNVDRGGGTFAYSCTTPAEPGAGNITDNPLFRDFAAGDYRLASGSPCRNFGFDHDWMTGALDLDGNRRIMDDRVDMGAYEGAPPAGSMIMIQ